MLKLSAGCGMLRVLLLTFFVQMRAEGNFEVCRNVHSREFQSFVTMTPHCPGFSSFLQHWTAGPPGVLLLVDAGVHKCRDDRAIS